MLNQLELLKAVFLGYCIEFFQQKIISYLNDIYHQEFTFTETAALTLLSPTKHQENPRTVWSNNLIWRLKFDNFTRHLISSNDLKSSKSFIFQNRAKCRRVRRRRTCGRTTRTPWGSWRRLWSTNNLGSGEIGLDYRSYF